MSDRLLELLEDTARERTAGLRPSTDPVARVEAAVRRDRVRRTGSAVAGAALSVVVVLAVVLVGVPHLTADPVPPATNEPQFPTVVRTVSFDGLPWPVAGSLVSDPGFVQDVELAMARDAASQPGQGFDPTVLFAGDVGDRRIVVARDDDGTVWVAHGVRGASVDSLEGMDQTYVLLSGLSPIAVLLPQLGTGADLLVLTPGTVRAAVATAPAIWPDNDPSFRTVDSEAGVAVVPLQPTAPFALDANTVLVRAAGTAATIEGALVALDDPDVPVPTQSDLGSQPTEVDLVVDDAFQAAEAGLGGVTTGHETSALASGQFDMDDGKTSVVAAVAQTVSSGVRSRAMAVRVESAGGGLATATASSPASSARQDPRPLVATIDYEEFRPAFGSVVWVDAPDGTVDYTYKERGRGALLTAHEVVPSDGLLWLPSRMFVTVVSVRGADGVERWHASAS